MINKHTFALHRTDTCKNCIFMSLSKPERSKAILLNKPYIFYCNKRKSKIISKKRERSWKQKDCLEPITA